MYGYSDNQLLWKKQPLARLLPGVADKLRTEYQYTGPFWLYQEDILNDRLRLLEEGLPGCSFYYSVKSQSNLTLLSLIAAHSRFGADVVSGGEMYRALRAGFTPDKIVFAGVGKSEAEIQAALDLRIRSIHVESVAELKDIARIAREKGVVAQISLRLNPDVEVDTHRHITTGKEENKFGMSEADVGEDLRHLGTLVSNDSADTAGTDDEHILALRDAAAVDDEEVLGGSDRREHGMPGVARVADALARRSDRLRIVPDFRSDSRPPSESPATVKLLTPVVRGIT